MERMDSVSLDFYDENSFGHGIDHRTIKGPPLSQLVNICPQPPYIKDMKEIHRDNCLFMIKPFKYEQNRSYEPIAINREHRYIDRWDEQFVRMPCSPLNKNKIGQIRWPIITHFLIQLKFKCDNRIATIDSLKRTIENCTEKHLNLDCLEYLINEIYSNEQRSYFLSTVLSTICSLALNVELICSQPPPLLRIDSDRSVTMSQRQAASLLACAFFCLFPFRSGKKIKKEYENFQNPNFETLYERGPMEKVEKLKCILHYFQRITQRMPRGVLTFRRRALPHRFYPKWSESIKGLAPMHLTTANKIEDIDCSLQVDFANKYIGGGVLSTGCVQEEIRFVLCPEMLISLLICEMMADNECIYIIGCERYSTYRGYSNTFQFAGDFLDRKPKDTWGRKWCHVLAIDATYFRHRSDQYNMKSIKRELIKAYTGFYSRSLTTDCSFPIATGNWGCGAFHGDRQLKAIIQLIVASEVMRPLIYAAFGDKTLVESFSIVYDRLIERKATVRDLYRYLQQYTNHYSKISLFDFILQAKD